MMKKLKYIFLGLVTGLSLVTVAVGTFAWFQNAVVISGLDNVEGNSAGAYFAYGKGTQSDPYGIKTPRHLYNLAWLQYSGMFNKSTDGTIDKQYYFELANDINMDGWVLPPIGTIENPFVGSFNGKPNPDPSVQPYTISNLKISNDSSSFNEMPSNISYEVQPKIVGLFGVIGESVNELSYDYEPSIVSFTNTTVSNITVESTTENTLIGLAAGFVNSPNGLSNIKVGKAKIDVDGCKPITQITSNLSDYSLVGFYAQTGTVSNFTKTISQNVNKITQGQETGGFNESVDFLSYLEWFYEDLHSKKKFNIGSKTDDVGFMEDTSDTYSTGLNSKSTTSSNYDLQSRVSSVRNPKAEFALTASFTNPYEVHALQKIGNDYEYSVTLKTDSKKGETLEVKASSVTQGYRKPTGSTSNYYYFDVVFSNNVTIFGKTVNKFTLYRSVSGTTLADGNRFYVYDYQGTYASANRWKRNSIVINFYYSNSLVTRLVDGNYIPLAFSDSTKEIANPNSTGYITGKSLSAVNGTPKISAYSKTTYLNNALSGGEISTVRSYNFQTNAFVNITETKENGKVTSGKVGNKTLARYVKPRNAIGQTISDNVNVFGIHFDNNSNKAGDVKTSNPTSGTMKTSWLDSAQTVNYPSAAINFYLSKTGYITFFAGTYTTTASVKHNFFSLHDVTRVDNSPTSFSLKEIKAIYQTKVFDSDNPTYIYKYVDNTYSDANITKDDDLGELEFDLSILWKDINTNDHRIYYFEIPVNAGHFAMGAVTYDRAQTATSQGAYMMYLDIGANGRSSGNNILNAQAIKTTPNEATYPKGIDFNVSGLTSVGGNTACISIGYTSGTISGSLEFTVSNVVVATTDDLLACNIGYKKSNSIIDVSGSTQTIGDNSGSPGTSYTIFKATITEATGNTWIIEYNDTTSTYITKKKNDIATSDPPPDIFTTNLSDIRSANDAVQMVFTGSDFSITAINYVGTRVSIDVPAAELGDKTFTVTYPVGSAYNEFYINGNPYPAAS